MSRIQLKGIDGSNPLGFMATLGLLRVLPCARLGFSDDGSYRAFVDGFSGSESQLAGCVAADAKAAADGNAPWRFTYTKAANDKPGKHVVADLKSPPPDFKTFLATCVQAWLSANEEPAGYAAAYGTDVAVDGKGNVKPTAFHFTAANQTFLGTVETIRASVTDDWVAQSLFDGHGERGGGNLRWDPAADRNWALRAKDPRAEETLVNAPLEWLAFRGLPLLPSSPAGSRVITTGVFGRGNDMTFSWPLWNVPASRETVRSILQLDWRNGIGSHRARGVFAVCCSSIRRTSQGYGNFGPAEVRC
jgi:hypothetical protein